MLIAVSLQYIIINIQYSYTFSVLMLVVQGYDKCTYHNKLFDIDWCIAFRYIYISYVQDMMTAVSADMAPQRQLSIPGIRASILGRNGGLVDSSQLFCAGDNCLRTYWLMFLWRQLRLDKQLLMNFKNVLPLKIAQV